MAVKKTRRISKITKQLLFLSCSLQFWALSCTHSQENILTSTPGSDRDTTTGFYAIRVLNFNIQSGKTTDGNFDIDLYAQIIKEQKPDIVALEEIDKGVGRSGKIDETTELAKRTGLKGYFGKFRNFGEGEFGDAILSKYPVLDFKVIPANSSLDEKHPRSYIFAKLKIADDTSIYFNCSHLTPYVEDQKTMQAKELVHYRDSVLDKQPLIVAGDLNSLPVSEAMKVLFNQFSPSDIYFAPTHNARTSLIKKIDYILYPKNKHWKVIEFKRICRGAASDHCAILAVLGFRKQE